MIVIRFENCISIIHIKYLGSEEILLVQELDAIFFRKIYFSSVLEYLNQLSPPRWAFERAPKFHGHLHLATQHVTSFIDYISDLNVVHEDVIMKLFVISMEEDANRWLKHLDRGEISSFIGLIKAFHKDWDDNYQGYLVHDSYYVL